MAKIPDKVALYRLERFDPKILKKLPSELSGYAMAIGGMPRNHSEVFNKRGWLLPFLFVYDELLNGGRWLYWLDILEKGTIAGSRSIPQIHWTDIWSPQAQAAKSMLDTCLQHHEATIDNFADWLLWGLGGSTVCPNISEGLNEHYYRIFDLFLVLDNPTDYLSNVLVDQTGKGYHQGLGYYPTPFNICRFMVEILHGAGEREEMKRQTVSDPCVGCGAMLLPASNYFLRAYASDISGIAVKLCTIQMFFYAPWYARPGQVQGFDETAMPIELVLAKPGKKVASGQLEFVL